MRKRIVTGGILVGILLGACSMPREVMLSPEVTPKGKFTAGYETGIHVPGAVIKALDDSAVTAIGNLINQDTAEISKNLLRTTSRMALAQSLDPLGSANSLYLAYGLLEDFEVGYEYLSSGHGLWMRYQVMPRDESGLAATTGLYASKQDYSLPSFMGKIQDALGYEFARQDFTVPFSIGRFTKGRYISREWAAVTQVQLSHVKYAFEPTVLYNVVDESDGGILENIPEQSSWFWSVGAALNGRIGLGPVFLGAGLGYYWQDYGKYTLPAGMDATLTGGTLAAHAALELRFWE